MHIQDGALGGRFGGKSSGIPGPERSMELEKNRLEKSIVGRRFGGGKPRGGGVYGRMEALRPKTLGRRCYLRRG